MKPDTQAKQPLVNQQDEKFNQENQFRRELDVPEAERYRHKPVKSKYEDTKAFMQEDWEFSKEDYLYKKNKFHWYDWIGEILPSFNWVRSYKPTQFLVPDLLAGISVGFMVVPQAISYANLAGVPPQYGLYGSFLPVIVYGLFGSSRHLVVGPVAVTSTLISQFLIPLVDGQEANTTGDFSPNNPQNPDAQLKYNHLVTQLAFVVSCIYTLVGLLRLGWLVHFLSHATVSGFMTGAALQILLSQVQYIAGYSYKGTLCYELIGQIFKNIRKFKWQEFIMGMIFIGILVLFRELSNRTRRFRFLKFCGPITIFILGILIVGAGKKMGTIKDSSTSGKPIRLVGNVVKGPPHFTGRQVFPMPDFVKILPAAIVVAAIDFTESNSIATALAIKGKYKLHYNKEIIGLGLANFMGTLFNSYTTTGSFSRSAVNYGAGAKTQLSGIVSSIIVLFVLLFLTPMFQFVPYNAIGAIIIVGVSNLIEPERAWYFFKVNFWDFLSWIGAFLVTFFAGIEYGLLTAVCIAALTFIAQVVFPHISEIGEVRDTNLYRPVSEYPNDIKTIESILVYRVQMPLNFANIANIRNHFREVIERRQQKGQDVKFLILDIEQTYRTDATVIHIILEYKEELELYGTRLVLACPQQRFIRMAEAAQILDHFGRDYIFATVSDAVHYCKLRRDFDIKYPKAEDGSDDLKKPNKDLSKIPNWANKLLPNRLFNKN